MIDTHPLTADVLSLGTLPPQYAPFWNDDPHSPTPRLLTSLEGGPYQFSNGTLAAAAELLAHIEPIHQQHLMLNKYVASQPTIAKIQRAYPANQTMLLEQQTADVTRNDVYFGQRVLNGMCASNLDRHPENPDQYGLYHHWHSYPRHSYPQTADFSLPDVDMRYIPCSCYLKLLKWFCEIVLPWGWQ